MTNEYKTEAAECRDIRADSATAFSAPQLKKCGHIYTPSATEFSAPQLQECGNICPQSAKRINL